LIKIAGVAGSLYLVTKYFLDRLQEMREAMRQEKLAKENLKKRFLQNQQDCIFTILALLPGLGAQIMEEMDVEGITQVLQGRSRQRGSPSREPSDSSNISIPPPSQNDIPNLSTFNPSGEPAEHLQVEIPSHPPQGPSSTEQGIPGHLADSSLSWVEQFSTSADSNGARSPSIADAHLSDSMLSGTVSNVSEVLSDLSQASSLADRVSGRTKGELWKDIKYLTFSRTLTIIYATSLLAILTHIQLNLIGRAKYLRSIWEMDRKEREESGATVGGFIWETLSGTFLGSKPEEPESPPAGARLSEVTEKKFLLLSWWLTHRGWRQIGHTLEQAFEEKLSSVSLKSKVEPADIRMFITEARSSLDSRSKEETTSRLNLASAILPPDTESLDQTLLSAGTPIRLIPSKYHDEELDTLFSEACKIIQSPSFTKAFEAAIESSFDVFFEYLEKEVFDSSRREQGHSPRLVDVLPGMARWNHIAISRLPNELVDRIGGLRELSDFSACIFSSFEETLY